MVAIPGLAPARGAGEDRCRLAAPGAAWPLLRLDGNRERGSEDRQQSLDVSHPPTVGGGSGLGGHGVDQSTSCRRAIRWEGRTNTGDREGGFQEPIRWG